MNPGECHNSFPRKAWTMGGHAWPTCKVPHRMPHRPCRRHQYPLVYVVYRHIAVSSPRLHQRERVHHPRYHVRPLLIPDLFAPCMCYKLQGLNSLKKKKKIHARRYIILNYKQQTLPSIILYINHVRMILSTNMWSLGLLIVLFPTFQLIQWTYVHVTVCVCVIHIYIYI